VVPSTAPPRHGKAPEELLDGARTLRDDERDAVSKQQGSFILREGITDYFTKISYNNNTDRSDMKLRKAVESPYHEDGITHRPPDLHT
jgi:hypothetical protein